LNAEHENKGFLDRTVTEITASKYQHFCLIVWYLILQSAVIKNKTI